MPNFGALASVNGAGIANRIYATRDVVLRAATDHPDAIVDALTESVAAPVAREAGIPTPKLIAFDNSGTLVDRPYSLWERVHGETLGLSALPGTARQEIWRAAGQQIGRLYERLKSCLDPKGYLDTTGRELRLDRVLRRFADSGHMSSCVVGEIEQLISDLGPIVSSAGAPTVFVHNDLHEWNIMCDRQRPAPGSD